MAGWGTAASTAMARVTRRRERNHGRDHYWQQLRQLATFTPGAGEVDSPEWHDGIWVPRAAGDQDQADRP